MAAPETIVPDSEHRGLVGRLPRPLRDYALLARFDRPIGIWLLLWPTLNALWIASDGHPRWPLLVIFALGTLLMRSAGCAMNDYADRDFDRHVKRTADRPLTSGKIRAWEAVAIAVVLVFALSIREYLIVNPILGYGTMGALSLWSFLYGRRARRQGEARRAAAAAAGNSPTS